MFQKVADGHSPLWNNDGSGSNSDRQRHHHRTGCHGWNRCGVIDGFVVTVALVGVGIGGQ